MSRNSTRSQSRAQTAAPQFNSGLAVTARLDTSVAQSGSAAGWEQLGKALGMAAPAVGKHLEKQDASALKDGEVDRRLNRVDQVRAAEQQKYADGVARSHVTIAAAEALAEIDARAATEVPPNAPLDQKLAWLNDQAMAELGPLATDRETSGIVAQLLQNHTNQFTNRELQVSRTQHQMAAVQATEVQLTTGLADGSFSYEAMRADLAAVQGEAAGKHLVDVIAQRAVAAHDPALLALIPVDHPDRLTPAGKARLEQATAAISQWEHERGKPARDVQTLAISENFEARIREGQLLTEDDLRPYVDRQVFSWEKAQSLINKSQAEYASRQGKQDEWLANKSALELSGGESFLDTLGMEFGAKNEQDAAKLFNQLSTELLNGLAEGRGKDFVYSGRNIANDDEALHLITSASRIQRLPNMALKGYMAGLSPSSPRTVRERLGAYRELAAKGVTGLYLDAEAEAVLEVALAAEDSNGTPEEIDRAVERSQDPVRRASLREDLPALQRAAARMEMTSMNTFFDVDVKTATNAPWVTDRITQIARGFYERGVPVEQALQRAESRFNETHFAMKSQGRSFVLPLPTDAALPDVMAAVEFFDKAAGEQAKKLKIDDRGTAGIRIETEGAQPIFRMVDGEGIAIPGTPRYSASELVAQMRKEKPSGYVEAAAAHRERITRLRANHERTMRRAYGRDISIQPKL